MAITKLNIKWYGQSLLFDEEYGVAQLAKNAWIVVEADPTKPMGFKTLAQVETREAAVGFLKLLKEN